MVLFQPARTHGKLQPNVVQPMGTVTMNPVISITGSGVELVGLFIRDPQLPDH
jgi:hypothetical protein